MKSISLHVSHTWNLRAAIDLWNCIPWSQKLGRGGSAVWASSTASDGVDTWLRLLSLSWDMASAAAAKRCWRAAGVSAWRVWDVRWASAVVAVLAQRASRPDVFGTCDSCPVSRCSRSAGVSAWRIWDIDWHVLSAAVLAQRASRPDEFGTCDWHSLSAAVLAQERIRPEDIALACLAWGLPYEGHRLLAAPLG